MLILEFGNSQFHLVRGHLVASAVSNFKELGIFSSLLLSLLVSILFLFR